MVDRQVFNDPGTGARTKIDFLPGVELMPLAQPVPDGSIQRARLAAGTTIPVHTHPSDEYVLVLSGTVVTGGRRCEAGTFWTTPPVLAKVRTSHPPTSSYLPSDSAPWDHSATALEDSRSDP